MNVKVIKIKIDKKMEREFTYKNQTINFDSSKISFDNTPLSFDKNSKIIYEGVEIYIYEIIEEILKKKEWKN